MFTSVHLGSAVHELQKAKLLPKKLKETLKEPLAQGLTDRKLQDTELTVRDRKETPIQGHTDLKLHGKQQGRGIRQPLQQGLMDLNVQSGKLLDKERTRALSPEAASFKLSEHWSKKILRNMFLLSRSRNPQTTKLLERNMKQTSD